MYLVGNMADLEEQRQVQKEEAEALVKELKFQKYIETSAFTGMNIDEAFTTMTKHLFVKHENELDTYVSGLMWSFLLLETKWWRWWQWP